MCKKEFKDEKTIIAHLKFDHFIKNNAEIKCLVKANSCSNKFHSFASLKSHLQKCSKKNTESQTLFFNSEENTNVISNGNENTSMANEIITSNRIENHENYFTFEGMVPIDDDFAAHNQSISDELQISFHPDRRQNNEFCEEMIQNSSKIINSKLAECSTKYKRTKRYESNPLYVAPKEFALNVRFNMSKAKDACVAVPRLIPCKFHYIISL